jgi:putative transposase
MRKSRYSDEQITAILGEARSGLSSADVCRKHGVSLKTFYGWRSRFGGMQASEVRKTKALEEENAKLKRIVADLMLDVRMLKDVNSKNW